MSTVDAQAAYTPVSRRPIASIFRRTAGGATALCVRWNVHPDLISYASMLAATGAAACFFWAARAHWLLILAPLLCYVRLWCNMLDGMVALASGKASRHGEIINDLPDRYSDIIIFAGVAESGLCPVSLGYWTALLAVMTAYVGTLSQAVGGPRQFGGWMSKPWRMVVLHLGAWATYAGIALGVGHWASHGLAIACAIILLGCIQTIFVRLRRTFTFLNQSDSTHD